MQKDILILGLGNELLADDGIGVHIVTRLQGMFSDRADIVSTPESGMALLDYFIGYKHAIIIDAIFTEGAIPGEVHQISVTDLDAIVAPSPHFAGLPEILATASVLELEFPEDIKIYALEVKDPFSIGGEISDAVLRAMPEVIKLTENQLALWESEVSHA